MEIRQGAVIVPLWTGQIVQLWPEGPVLIYNYSGL